MEFLIVDGEIFRTQAHKSVDFTYQSTIQFTKRCWYGYGGIPLLQENIIIVKKQLELLNLPVPEVFNNLSELFRIVKRMLNKNKLYRSGYIRFNIYSDKKSTHWIADCNAFEHFDFPLDNQGVLLEISKKKKLSSNQHLDLPFSNHTLWQQVESETTEVNLSQKIIINERNELCETPNANIFLIKEKTLMTPPLHSGSYNDTVQPLIKEIAHQTGLRYEDSLPVNVNTLALFDEILLIGEETGIIRVLGIDKERFIPQYNSVFHKNINSILEKRAQE